MATLETALQLDQAPHAAAGLPIASVLINREDPFSNPQKSQAELEIPAAVTLLPFAETDPDHPDNHFFSDFLIAVRSLPPDGRLQHLPRAALTHYRVPLLDSQNCLYHEVVYPRPITEAELIALGEHSLQFAASWTKNEINDHASRPAFWRLFHHYRWDTIELVMGLNQATEQGDFVPFDIRFKRLRPLLELTYGRMAQLVSVSDPGVRRPNGTINRRYLCQ